MHKPVTFDLNLYRGDTYRLPLRITTNVGTAEAPDYLPVDLTGHEGVARIARKADGIVEASFEVTFTDPTDGRVTLLLTDAESRKLTNKARVWDFQTTSEEFGTRTWIAGAVAVTLDVSEPEPEPEPTDA